MGLNGKSTVVWIFFMGLLSGEQKNNIRLKMGQSLVPAILFGARFFDWRYCRAMGPMGEVTGQQTWGYLHESSQYGHRSCIMLPLESFNTTSQGVSIVMELQQWMVYKGKSQFKMGDDWGYPHDSGNLHLVPLIWVLYGFAPNDSTLSIWARFFIRRPTNTAKPTYGEFPE